MNIAGKGTPKVASIAEEGFITAELDTISWALGTLGTTQLVPKSTLPSSRTFQRVIDQ